MADHSSFIAAALASGAAADHRLDGWIAAAQTLEFWQRSLGHALEAGAYSAALTAVDQLLVHRDELINGTTGLGLRLITSAVGNPTRQERQAFRQFQCLLQEMRYALQRDSDGNLTITVLAQPAL